MKNNLYKNVGLHTQRGIVFMGISYGNDAIQRRYDELKDYRNQQRDKTREATEQNKTDAAQGVIDAFGEVNTNHSDTLTGAIAEGASDIWATGASVFTAIDAYFADAYSDGVLAVDELTDDAWLGICAFGEKRLNEVGNFFAGTQNIAQNLWGAIGELFNEGIEENHEAKA